MKLLITGIPGTGKTTIAQYLADRHGFTHIDLEASETKSEASLLEEIDNFVAEHSASDKNIVMSWGFPYEYASLVVFLKRNGVDVVWFDGNRTAARQVFIERGDVPEKAFHEQVANIDRFKIVEAIQPRIINTFDDDGEFKTFETIVSELI